MYHNDYTALEVTRYILSYLHEKGESVTGLGIHSILYFVQAEFLARFEYTAFNDPIYSTSTGAWLPTIAEQYPPTTLSIPYWKDSKNNEYIWMTEKEKEILRSTVMSLMPYSDIQLQNMIKSQNPWKKYYQQNTKNIISINYIYNCFKRKNGPNSFKEEEKIKSKKNETNEDSLDSKINYKNCFIVSFILFLSSILWQVFI